MSKGIKRPREEVALIASQAKGWLKTKRINSCICGSLRRKIPQVRDADIAVESGNLLDVTVHVANACRRNKIKCELNSNVKLESKKVDITIAGIKFNIYKAKKDEWGSMLLTLTGNFLFNILMRARAKTFDLKLNQYGLFHSDEIIAGKTEEQIFAALGMPYVRPEDREYKRGMYLPQL